VSGENPSIEEPGITDPELRSPSGAFVTLRVRGRLRGCIGTVSATRPTWRTVREMAEAAALRDPRFAPIDPGDLDDLEFEISVLSPMKPVNNPESIRIGRDGLCIRSEGSSGILLPQVATEHGWDHVAFLKHLCLKADLPADAWRDEDVELLSFQAEVF